MERQAAGISGDRTEDGSGSAMSVILLVTILTLSALYAPQPLLPVIVAEFGVTREAAAFLTTVCFIPLSIAPLFYGYVLESLSPRRLLRGAVLLLAFSEILFYFATSFPLLIGVRLFQGLLIPALLTSLMTYIATVTPSGAVQRAMSIYIAATILGGFLGRACSGMLATWFGWRSSFLVLAASLLVSFFLLRRLADTAPLGLVRPTPRILLEVFRDRALLPICLVVFCLFLVFAAIMNFLPFRLTELSDRASELRIGLMYTGYLLGMVSSLNAVSIGRYLGGERRAMLVGLTLLAVALVGLGVPRVEIFFAVMFLFCGAMFLVHATASGLLNRRAGANKGIVNGLYVAFYYAGGSIGSFLPGYAYRYLGWNGFLALLLLVAVAGLCFALRVRQES
jgi:YNFM family putative membrane transporter